MDMSSSPSASKSLSILMELLLGMEGRVDQVVQFITDESLMDLTQGKHVSRPWYNIFSKTPFSNLNFLNFTCTLFTAILDTPYFHTEECQQKRYSSRIHYYYYECNHKPGNSRIHYLTSNHTQRKKPHIPKKKRISCVPLLLFC